MLTYIMTCETCGSRRPFPVSIEEQSSAQTGNALPRHCPACRTMTNWTIGFTASTTSCRSIGPRCRDRPMRDSYWIVKTLAIVNSDYFFGAGNGSSRV